MPIMSLSMALFFRKYNLYRFIVNMTIPVIVVIIIIVVITINYISGRPLGTIVC